MLILGSIAANCYEKDKIKINNTSKDDKEIYINLVTESNKKIFMYDASNILNNILEKTEVTMDIMEQLNLTYDFYKQLKDDFTNIYVPKEFVKNNKFLINNIEKCMESLNIDLNISDINTIKNYAINFIKSNNEIIKILENIIEDFEKNNY